MSVGACCKGCPYTAANRKIRAVPYGVVNNWTYLAHSLYPDVLIVDEAHTLLAMLRDLNAKKLWRREYKYPERLRTYADLLEWVSEERKHRAGDGRGPDKKLDVLWADLVSGRGRYLVERAREAYRGQEQDVLKLLPIDTCKAPPTLWPPGKVQKVVLLSATLGTKDLEQLGLAGRRTARISTPSPIPAQVRPIVVARPGFRVGTGAGSEDHAALAQYICDLAEGLHKGQRGVIHATYALAEDLLPALSARLGSRLFYHDSENKSERFNAWLDAGQDAVLLCSGLYEGIDLPGDLGRWQVLAKCPWPSLGEPAWKWVAETDPERFSWETLKLMMQGSGRICRGPGDFGVTYVADQSFSRLPLELAPSWFLDSLRAGEEYAANL